MTAVSNQNDEPKDSFENGDDSEGTEQCQEIIEDGSLDGVKEYSTETIENDNVGEPVESTNEEKGADENKRNRELLERMVEENEKMMRMMTQLFERNEAQTRMLNALTHRVGLLEKAFVCDRLRKKKKCKAACRED
ncbi:UNVERIFIED_CONTAM: hypothetical protein Slati_3182700 [Sesamum latifolium]|uniref:Uncharacterized protein n=1 Tax=Sesamum latifolium TaxID=2727402 RepID=A0AAW2UXC3_9LAMI